MLKYVQHRYVQSMTYVFLQSTVRKTRQRGLKEPIASGAYSSNGLDHLALVLEEVLKSHLYNLSGHLYQCHFQSVRSGKMELKSV